MMAFATNFPRKRNFEQTSSTMLNRVLGPMGKGKSPTGLWTYWGVLEAPVGVKQKINQIQNLEWFIRT